jgi:hypothetical protein
MPALGLLPGGQFEDFGSYLPPQLPLVNMYAEGSKTEPSGFFLASRPILGTTVFGTPIGEYGSGPIRALYQANGVVSGDRIALSDDDFYVDGVDKGDVAGSGFASIAGNEVGAVVTAGDDAKYYDGSTLQTIAFPDSAKVTKVIEQGSRFVFLRAQSQKYYWTLPGSNMISGGNIVIDPLDFASAENEPDWLVDAIVWQDHLILGGNSTIELHGVTGNDDLPWSPTLGSTIQTGVIGTGCMTTWGGTFAWISPGGVVYAGPGRERLSTQGVETYILESATCALDSFFLFGLEFLRARLDDFDLVFHNGEWAQWSSDAIMAGFIGGPVIQDIDFGIPVFGSNLDGKLLSTFAGAGGEFEEEFVRLFRFGLPIDGGAVTFNNVGLRCSKGIVADAQIEMRYSRDGGYSWSDWKPKPLGDPGEYRTKVEWRALGLMDSPGFLAECRVLSGNQFVISGAYFNENMSGRKR